MSTLLQYATTREVAICIWVAILAISAFFFPKIPGAVADLLKALSSWKVWLPLLLYLAYFVWVIWILDALSLWAPSLLGATIIWFFASGISLFLDATAKSRKQRNYFWLSVRRLATFAVLLEFAMNAMTFSLLFEFFLVPLVSFLACLQVVGKTRKEWLPAWRLITLLLSLIGLFLVGMSISKLIQNPPESPWDLARLFLLPFLLGLAAIPPTYALALVATYEILMKRSRGYSSSVPLPFRVRAGLILSLRASIFDIDQLAAIASKDIAKLTTFSETRRMVQAHKSQAKLKANLEKAATTRFDALAGVKGTDVRGRQLDRREFSETKKALVWVHDCTSGWYDKSSAYRADMLEILGDFTSRGLREPNGITMKTRKDGQAWYAFRQLPSGYVLGIGANAAPNSQWMYHGERPPSGFPSTRSDGWTNTLLVETPLEWLSED